MTKFLHTTLFFVTLLAFNAVNAQVIDSHDHSSHHDHDVATEHLASDMVEIIKINKSELSYKKINCTGLHHNEQIDAHTHTLSQMDFISSDEGFDFICSGGFCMNKTHFHKKGVTPKKQLFVYFMKISC